MKNLKKNVREVEKQIMEINKSEIEYLGFKNLVI
jgi:hypothetical protein